MSADRSVIAAMIELSCAKSVDWDSTIQHILSVEANVLDVERVSFWLVSDEPQSLACEMAYQRSTRVLERGTLLAFAEHEDFFEAVLRDVPLVVEDVRSDPRVRSLASYFDSRGISSVLGSPVWVEGEVAGVLCLEHVGPPRRWSGSDVRFSTAVAQTAAVALEARELAAARRGAQQSTFLDQSSRTLHETLDEAEVARRAVALAVPRLADAAVLDVVDQDVIRRVAFQHATVEGQKVMQAALESREFPRDAGPPLPERVIARRDSILIPDLGDEALVEAELNPRGREAVAAVRELGIRSLVATPLLFGSRITGVLQLHASRRRYGVADLRLAEELARRVACALHNARTCRRAEEAARSLLGDAEELARLARREPCSAGVAEAAEHVLDRVKRLSRGGTS